MSTKISNVVLGVIGTSITFGMFLGVMLLLDMVIPLGKFFPWFGLASSGIWFLFSIGLLMETMKNDDSEINGELRILSWGLSASSLSAFGYLVFG